MKEEEIALFYKEIRTFFSSHILGMRLLTKPKDFGGWGLLNFDIQLLGRRAQYIYHVLTDKRNWHYKLFRHKSQLYILQLLTETKSHELPYNS